MPAYKVLSAAVVQDAPVVYDTPATLEKVCALASDAAKHRPRLIVFPEAFIGGYPYGQDFGARIGLRTPEGREEFRRYYEGAIDVPGPACEMLGRVAKSAGAFLVFGVIEREFSTLYCTALFFNPEGQLLGKHRKLMPTAVERLVWGCGDGSTMPVFPTPIGRLGAAICWENYMPLYRMHLYGQGIELYCAPTVDSRETWTSTVRHIALEGRCFVLSANQFTRRSDFPAQYETVKGNDPNTVMCGGGSCIINPLGQFLAGPNRDGPSILTAELDMNDIPRSRMDLDVRGHYARPDVFRLHVNTAPTPPVVTEPFEENSGDC